MAMNKTERARLDMLEQKLLEAKALRFPDYRPAQIDVAEVTAGDKWNDINEGWSFNTYSFRISHGWFGANSHGSMPRDTKHISASQGCGGPWYKTHLDAMMAMRIAVTDQYAKTLAALDGLIEKETNE